MLRVAVGLAVLGATSYVYLSVAARTLSPAGFASISVLWSIVYIVGPGVFQPFEQQIGRELAGRLARGGRSLGRWGRSISVAVVIVLALCAATLIFLRPVARALFDGSATVVVALMLSFVALAAAYLYRGVLAGAGRFDLYGSQLAAEGAARLAGCFLIWWLAPGVAGFAVLIPVAQAVSVAVTARPGRLLLRAHHRVRDRVEPVDADRKGVPSTRPVPGRITWLIGAGLLSQALVNASTLLARLLYRNSPDLVGHLQAGLLIARVPLLLFAAVPAALLPRLAAMAATGQFAAMRRRTDTVVIWVGLTMAAATVLAGLVGTRVVRLFFGSAFDLPGSTLAALTGGTGLFMMAGVAASAVVAAGSFGRATLGWACGAVAMVGALALPAGPTGRIVGGFVAGTAVSFLALSILGRLSMSDSRAGSAEPSTPDTGTEGGRRIAGTVRSPS